MTQRSASRLRTVPAVQQSAPNEQKRQRARGQDKQIATQMSRLPSCVGGEEMQDNCGRSGRHSRVAEYVSIAAANMNYRRTVTLEVAEAGEPVVMVVVAVDDRACRGACGEVR